MIKSLKVEGLNHRINVDLNFNEDLNIITGKNGSGKTTLLKLLWYLISGNLERIFPEIPIQSVSIDTDSFSLSITKVDPDEGRYDFKLIDKDGNGRSDEKTLRLEEFELVDAFNLVIAEKMKSSLFFPTFRRIEGGFAGGDISNADFDWIQPTRPRHRISDRTTSRLQEAMAQLASRVSVFDHKFIASISTHDIVELLTEKYAAIYRTTNALNVQLSQEITQRISETSEHDDANLVLKGIEERVREAAEERDKLLRPFSVLDERIPEIFHYSGIRVTPGIVLGEENKENEAIASDKLSAGEKQMLSFLCYNTFSENAAIFIDEPELSLHVDWQRILVPTLLEQETGNQFFIATHSPFIYGKYPNKEILLGDDRGAS